MSSTEPPRPAPLDTIARALRQERQAARLSLSELAKRAGVAKSTLSQLESGSGNPSVETLWALASALGVSLSALVDPPRPAVTVIRAGEGPVVHSEHADYTATLLAACPPNARRDAYAITAEPGSVRASDPHSPGTVEHVWLGTGSALAGDPDTPVTLSPGDYMSYPGDRPHVFQALAAGTTALFLIEHA
ncbi:helix-turn-helix domain-containing protein [Streptomyces sp. ODS05-4]|uniref:helix-turn-helix domain-containing protein n=1 Tax=Streptomyces sp. ODS05-4 TaxID=2944939 RepID=UPI00210CCAEC|nr:XRE family transcriptional regulator [Streptomyces sp. ODS05-4]